MEKPVAAGEKVGGRVEKERIAKAVDALVKWEHSRKNREKAQLLEDDKLLYLVVSLKKIPDQVRTNPYEILVPHPLFNLDGCQDVCLFVDDRKGLKQKEAKQKLAEEKIPIAKVIGLSKLKTDYKPFEAKRKLCGSYDLFLADKSTLPFLPKLLGKGFFRKKKHPIPVDLKKKDWKKQIEGACGSVFLYVKGGSCSVVKVGRLSQTRDEIVENITAVLLGVASTISKSWKNIRSLYLKTIESVPLPLYQALPELPLKINVSQGGLGLSSRAGGTKLGKSDRTRGKKVVLEMNELSNVPGVKSEQAGVDSEDSGAAELEGKRKPMKKLQEDDLEDGRPLEARTGNAAYKTKEKKATSATKSFSEFGGLKRRKVKVSTTKRKAG